MLAQAVAPTPMAADASEAAPEHFEHLIPSVRSPETRQMPQRAREARLEVAGRAVWRRLRQAPLDERSPGTGGSTSCSPAGKRQGRCTREAHQPLLDASGDRTAPD